MHSSMKRIYIYCLLLIAALCFSGQNSLYAVTTSPDLKWAEAQGPVKTIIQDGITMQFDRSGRITSLYFTNASYDRPPKIDIRRNSEGQIVQISYKVFCEPCGDGSHTELFRGYTYDASGYVSEIGEEFFEAYTTTTFTNDANGRHKQAIESCEGDCMEYITSFTYPQIDSYGNWTKRQNVYHDVDMYSLEFLDKTTSRVIIYWDDTPDSPTRTTSK